MDLPALIKAGHLAKSFDGSVIEETKLQQFLDLLRSAPSSFNLQPWHFVVAATQASRERVANSMRGGFEANQSKVRSASHVIVFCSRMSLPQSHLDAVREEERVSGRFPGISIDQFWQNILLPSVAVHEYDARDTAKWLEKQTYLALGVALMGAAALGIDVAAMEGFHSRLLDADLGLRSQGYTSIVLLAIGRRTAEDHVTERPKPRLPVDQLFTFLE
ncbi:nitroreductase family protein [Acidisphaera sp. S103]|uniref:nitroreductase family protein n=1 Tax=Acidisphaera sp. S103 TaxID=1747223 RepID=UPI00131A675B|nr:nitroreductase family protein [Acidisphaera sp. S103]